jgi:hypothetical protein
MPSLYVIHFKCALNSGDAQVWRSIQVGTQREDRVTGGNRRKLFAQRVAISWKLRQSPSGPASQQVSSERRKTIQRATSAISLVACAPSSCEA